MNEGPATFDAARSEPTDAPVRGLFIDGAELPAARRRTFPVLSPGNGRVTAYTMDAAIRSTRRAFEGPDWCGMSERTRIRLVYKRSDALDPQLDELETLNNGCPSEKPTRSSARSRTCSAVVPPGPWPGATCASSGESRDAGPAPELPG